MTSIFIFYEAILSLLLKSPPSPLLGSPRLSCSVHRFPNDRSIEEPWTVCVANFFKGSGGREEETGIGKIEKWPIKDKVRNRRKEGKRKGSIWKIYRYS
jgi:hypothetical protein